MFRNSRRVWKVRAIPRRDRKSTRLNSSHANISYAVFCLKKKKQPYPTEVGRVSPTAFQGHYIVCCLISAGFRLTAYPGRPGPARAPATNRASAVATAEDH